jgi:CheY-like chemotaxis protein
MARVLYVEDHDAQRDIMVQMLELYGYEVEVACNGEGGVEKTREYCPDVILMDVRMPGQIDGLVATRQLRNDPKTEDIPIIVVSAWGSAKHKERAMTAGADVHFTKPVTMDELIGAINRLLSDGRPRRDTIQEVTRRADIQRSSEIPAKRELSINKVLCSLFPWMRSWVKPHEDRPSQDTLTALGKAFASTEHDLVGMLSNIQSTVELMMSSSPKHEQVKRIWRASRHCLRHKRDAASVCTLSKPSLIATAGWFNLRASLVKAPSFQLSFLQKV